jgi:hypothetical protein
MAVMSTIKGAIWGGAAVLLCLFAGCRSVPLVPTTPDPAPAGLDIGQLEAPGMPTDWTELERLATGKGTGRARLRQASLYLRVGRPEKAQIGRASCRERV